MKNFNSPLFGKLALAFLAILVIVGAAQIATTVYFARAYHQDVHHLLNRNVAAHLVEEKFQDATPFLEDGSVNRELFGDIMHDMMAVNRAIEVYLLDTAGRVRYSVVLDHDAPNAVDRQVELDPIQLALAQDAAETEIILGTDPSDISRKKAFSVAPFKLNGQAGFIYIVLAGKVYDQISQQLLGSYFLRLGTIATLITLLFAMLVGMLALWYLTRSLRQVIHAARRFKAGDYEARVPEAERSDLADLATTFNEMADTLVDNIEQLKAVDTLRQELIANISHDLRTPLAVIHGYLETLQLKNEQLDADTRARYLDVALRSSERLGDLVGQLFEYAKLEARQVEPQKERFFLSDLVQDVLRKYELLAAQKGIELTLDAPDNLPFVFADIGLVDRVLQNLIDNAMKFTPSGGRVTLSLTAHDRHIEVRVLDTGPGIPEEQRAYIFERYHRIDRNNTSRKAGAGLGLAIVKKILEIHNATIEVYNRPQPEHGAIFQFSLPR